MDTKESARFLLVLQIRAFLFKKVFLESDKVLTDTGNKK
jgi:hypothetical protein